MSDRSPFRAVVFLLLALAGAAAIGAGAYQAGVQRGFVEAGRTAAAVPVEGTSHVYIVPEAWHGAWHGGFFPLFPLVVAFVLVAFVVRGLAWRGRGGCGPGGRGWRRDGVPPAFEEWHRRAHERMAGSPPPAAGA